MNSNLADTDVRLGGDGGPRLAATSQEKISIANYNSDLNEASYTELGEQKHQTRGVHHGNNFALPLANQAGFRPLHTDRDLGLPVKGNQSLSDEGPLVSKNSIVPKMALNNNLMNLNLPKSQFSHAINFESLSQHAERPVVSGAGDGSCEERFDTEEESMPRGINTNSHGAAGVLDASFDMLEQQQAKEQARLMDRFRQLHHWQLQQQQQLVLQQEREMQQLKENTQRVHTMISQKRQMQWGGSLNKSLADSVKMVTPPRKSKPHSTIPQVLARGAVAQARHYPKADSTEQVNRPVPDFNHIPTTLFPSNPNTQIPESELDSESGTLSTGGIMRAEGVFPLPDTASEASEFTPSPQQQGHLQHQLGHNPQQQHFVPHNKLFKYAPHAENGPLYFESPNAGGDTLMTPDQFTVSKSRQNGAIDFNKLAVNKSGKWFNRNRNSEMISLTGDGDSEGEDTLYFHGNDSRNLDSSYKHVEADRKALENLSAHSHMESQIRVQVPQVMHLDTSLQTELPGDHVEHFEPLNSCTDTHSQKLCLTETDSGVYAETVVSKESREEDMRMVCDTDRNGVLDARNDQGHQEVTGTSPSPQQHDSMAKPETEPEVTHDEMPVKGVAGYKKSFQELLEEELRKEEARLKTSTQPQPKKTASSTVHSRASKKTFLRKGEGISRFGYQQKSLPTAKRKEPDPVDAKKEEKREANVSSLSQKGHTKPPSPMKLQLKRKVSPQKQPKTETAHSDGNTTIEASFCNMLQQREQIEIQEKEELQEFELLEQFADDNASFASNSSFVKKVVSGKNIIKDIARKHEQASKEDRNTREENKVHVVEQRHEADNELDDDTDELTTSAESLTEDESDSSSDTAENDTMVDEELEYAPNQKETAAALLQGKSPRTTDRKTSPSGNPKMVEITDVSSEKEPTHREIAVSTAVKPNQFPEPKTEEVTNEDEASNADDDSGSESAESDEHSSLSDSDKENQVKVDIVSDKKSAGTQSEGPVREIEFEDDTSWGDYNDTDDEEPVVPVKLSSQTSKRPVIIKEKVSLSSMQQEASDQGRASSGGDVVSVPPTSQLVTKLFPKLQSTTPKLSTQQQQQQQKLQQASQEEVKDSVTSKALRDKLMQLEQEIERFRSENSTLAKLRAEREQGLVKLQKEIEDFEKQKSEELQRLKEFKDQELKKIKKERKLFDQYQKTARSMPDKKDREQIETLKSQLTELQEECKRKETRAAASAARLRDRISQLELENKELKEEVKMLEKKRLNSWQKDQSKMDTSVRESGSFPVTAIQKNTQTAVQTLKKSPVAADLDKVRAVQSASATHNMLPPENANLPVSSQKPIQAKREGDIAMKDKTDQKQGLPRKLANPAKQDTHNITLDDENYDEIQHPDGKIERIYTDGAREILFANGTRKQIASGGQSITVSFFNGDVKQIMPDQRVVYYYANTKITNTTYPDGLEIIQFPNNQLEKHYPDGTREITFPDQTIKYLFPNGCEESIFLDGTVIRVEKNGDKTMEFPNGQREIHTHQFKKREYPDGTVKTVYPDGRQETRYSTGRVRIKDKDGNIIVDKHEPRS